MSRFRDGLRRRLRRQSGYDELARRLAKAEASLQRQDGRIARHGERLDRHKERLDAVKPTVWRAATLLDVLAVQIGAIEERLESLSDKVAFRGDDPTDAEKAEARSLLDEVREEHRRIRVRFGVVTRYEERVRRLESALAEEMAAAEELANEAARHGALANAPTHGAVDIPEDPVDDADASPVSG
jgi:chromosome segregation ATPase